MTLAGLDLNGSRARAVGGSRSQAPLRLLLDGPNAELPLALSLEGKAIAAGRAGLSLARARPHQACVDFLHQLGSGHTWAGARHKVTADEALGHLFASLSRAMGRVSGAVLCLPAYLDEMQVYQAHRLADAARIPILGTIQAPLAALVSRAASDPLGPLPGLTLVVDCDGHALTWAVADCVVGRSGARMVRPSPHLGRAAWLRRLLDGVSNRFIRQCRRDPRDDAATEQSLYEQLFAALEAGPLPSLVPLGIQGDGWSHHLLVPAEDLQSYTAPLLRQAIVEMEGILGEVEPLGGIQAALLTNSAAGLPGLASAVTARVRRQPASDDGDFGDAMLASMSGDAVRALGPDALASAAHEVAVRMSANLLPRGHLDELAFAAPGGAPPPDPGPPRLHFRGMEHPVVRASFLLGRDPACDLVFESDLYPHVSARHCEIVFDRRHFLLLDRSRHGTLLNDKVVNQQAPLHSGDWIRLGPRGPVLRFLGQGKPAG
jgi:hypothetical protein